MNGTTRRIGHSAENKSGKSRKSGFVKFALGGIWHLCFVNDIREGWAFNLGADVLSRGVLKGYG